MKNVWTTLVGIVSLVVVTACTDDNLVDDYAVDPNDIPIDNSIDFDFDTTPEIEAKIEAGMNVFSSNGRIQNGAACVNCHAPDGFDLAFFDFKREDIIRRALPHITEEEANTVAEFVEATRQKYRISNPKNPREAGLFQPGGQVLAGNTRGERDYAFLKNELPKWVPTVFSETVDNEETALKVRDELANLNLQEMRIGITLPFWAGDPHHGDEFGTVNEWMPNMPCLDTSPKMKEYRTAYAKYPSRENLKTLINAVSQFTDCDQDILSVNDGRGAVAKDIARKKYIAGLVAMHVKREEIFGIPQTNDGDYLLSWWEGVDIGNTRTRSIAPSNFIWEIGDHARKPRPDWNKNTKTYPPNSAQELMEAAGFNQFSLDGETKEESRFLFMNDLQTSWFWTNSTFDSNRFTGYSRLAFVRSGYAGHAMVKGYFDTYKSVFGNFSYSQATAFHPNAFVKMTPYDAYTDLYEAPPGYEELHDYLQTQFAWTLLYVTSHWINDPSKKKIGKNDDLEGVARAVNFLWRLKGDEKALEWYQTYGYEIAKHIDREDIKEHGVRWYMEWLLDNPITGGPGNLSDGHGNANDENKINDLNGEPTFGWLY